MVTEGILVPLHIIFPSRIATIAPVLLFGQPTPSRFVGMVRPHVSEEVLVLCTACAADVAPSTFEMVVLVFAGMGGACQLRCGDRDFRWE